MAASEETESDDLLAAYMARRGAGPSASETAPVPDGPEAPEGPPERVGGSDQDVDEDPDEDPPLPEPSPPVAPTAGTDAGVSSLWVPTAPGLSLSDRLSSDPVLTSRGIPVLRDLGIVLLATGLFMAAWGAPTIFNTRTWAILTATAATLGAMSAAVFWAWPARRHPVVKPPEDQGQEWRSVQAAVRGVRMAQTIGLAAFFLGLVLALVAPLWGAAPSWLRPAAWTLAFSALVLMALAFAHRGPLRRLYIQTLLLSRLEELGRAPRLGDSRLAPVLRSLDRLMGALPEGQVRAFLGTKEAQDYLDLLDELSGKGASEE